MSSALLYLWWTLLRRRVWHACRSLRRPATFIGFIYVAGLVGCLFYYRRQEVFAHLVRTEVAVGGAWVMLCGSVLKGFMQRGLVFEPPDVEFIFTGPFTRRQVLLYRLLPQYVYALIQGLVFGVLFAPHLRHPVVVAACVILFQVVCFHVATAAAVLGGAVSDSLHYRLRWMLVAASFVLSALYLRVAWEIHLVPSFVRSPPAQLLFYPAASLPQLTDSAGLQRWILEMAGRETLPSPSFLGPLAVLAGFALAALLSLWALFRVRANLFEPALDTTTRVAEKRLRVKQGRPDPLSRSQVRSARLPGSRLFHGVGALAWKNLVAARRSRRELLPPFAFVLIVSTILTALSWKVHRLASQAGPGPGTDAPEVLWTFYLGIASFVASLAFFLQRVFPFDFRRDGRHLVEFRTLPVSPFALALAEVSVPVFLVLACQAVGLVPLVVFGWFPWRLVVLLVLGCPAVALGLNSVWNLHYLLVAARQAAGRAHSASAFGTMMVVALSFLVFYPACWTWDHLRHYLGGPYGQPVSLGAALAIQFSVDFALILILAELFQRFEVSRQTPGAGGS